MVTYIVFVHMVRHQLSEVQDAILLNKNPDLLQQGQVFIDKFNLVVLQEEHLLLLQKSWVKWMTKGDGNNSYFHQQCKVNWNQNKVLSLENEDGILVYGQQNCVEVAVSYFKILMTNASSQDHIDLSSVSCKTITPEQSSSLVAPVTDLLILRTLKSMKRNKAPGPDGVNVEFFLATWETTGPSFCEVVKFSFSTSTMSVAQVPTGYQHRWKCKELNISYLFFVDDVLLFARGSKDSVLHIMNKLAKFSVWNGLNPSVHKSTSFLCNREPDFIAWFDETYSILIGTLPVRFLGIPLIFSQLCINECIPLIERITCKLNSWENLLLSLAGRTLLIKSIVHALQAF
ncbi:uncharacterized protein LOC141680955 [Apium graveolens]|uniref:uncharacterized protein LOC141680955 n=1 Tax=Apium graveolens TaxID=4045 RepID=UPI003D799462